MAVPRTLLRSLLTLSIALALPRVAPQAQSTPQQPTGASGPSILLYHRFGAAVNDSMTIRTATFRTQLEYLKEHNYPVVPLRTIVSYRLGKGPAPPPHAVAITADDGHISIYREMLPLVREYKIPVTLFIYPSAISNASYGMTWDQLAELQRTGLFDIQSHTYWHPNFKTEKRRLSPAAYQSFVNTQLTKPRTVLKNKLGVNADLLAWPFGIYDDDLLAVAGQSGYVAAFTIDRRLVAPGDRIMALPRFLVTDSDSGRRFTAMLPR